MGSCIKVDGVLWIFGCGPVENGWSPISIWSDFFREVLEKAVKVGLGIIGGQVQFKLPDGTCELYWHKYDTTERKSGENWKEYCQRTKEECLSRFEKLPTDNELIKEGIESFDLLKEKSKNKLSDFLIFILYFNDKETEQ